MRVIFDQNVPRNLSRFLNEHEVYTAAQLGWEELQNGDFLNAAEAEGFDVFLTGDQSLAYQQNLQHRVISIIALTKNNWPSIEPNIAEIIVAVNSASRGSYQIVECTYVFKGERG